MPKHVQPQYQPSNMQYMTFNAFLWQNGNKSIIQYFEQVGTSLRFMKNEIFDDDEVECSLYFDLQI